MSAKPTASGKAASNKDVLDADALDGISGGIDSKTAQGAVTAGIALADVFKKAVADRQAKREADRVARMKSKKK